MIAVTLLRPLFYVLLTTVRSAVSLLTTYMQSLVCFTRNVQNFSSFLKINYCNVLAVLLELGLICLKTLLHNSFSFNSQLLRYYCGVVHVIHVYVM